MSLSTRVEEVTLSNRCFVPWGLQYRVLAAGEVFGNATKWIDRSLREAARLKSTYGPAGPPATDRFRVDAGVEIYDARRDGH